MTNNINRCDNDSHNEQSMFHWFNDSVVQNTSLSQGWLVIIVSIYNYDIDDDVDNNTMIIVKSRFPLLLS